jgi:hypothetical protein
MNDSAPTRPDDSAANAWYRHYAEAAERRRAAIARHPNHDRPYLRYARREARWALAIGLLVFGLLVAWAVLYRS